MCWRILINENKGNIFSENTCEIRLGESPSINQIEIVIEIYSDSIGSRKQLSLIGERIDQISNVEICDSRIGFIWNEEDELV